MKRNQTPELLGFSFEKGGAHTARTMMLDELRSLLSFIDSPDATKADYSKAIMEDNCLGKRSGKTRHLTFRHLVDLYSLDSSHILFRALRFFWTRDQLAQPLLALLCAYARDSLLRMTAPYILGIPEGNISSREALEGFIENQQPGRFSPATLKSTAQNINSTWTKSGHLRGSAKKTRARAQASPASLAYVLLLGHLQGERGQALFQTEYAKLLDCSLEHSLELAEEAGRRGWIVFKRIGNVMEVQFPSLIRPEEMEWLHEQN